MSIPVFKLAKIEHKSVKARKDFVVDVLIVGVGVSCLQVALEDGLKEGVKKLHKNKHRKNIRKIKASYEKLKEKQRFLYSIICRKDLETIDYKNRTVVKDAFIDNIAEIKGDISLEYIAISVLEQGLLRSNRKTPLNNCFLPFCDFKTLYKDIAGNVEVIGDMSFEWDIAKKFVSDIRYDK